MNKFPITRKGFVDLQKKLKKLKHFDRPNIIDSIKTAREHGDIRENADYSSAKEEQYLIEKKIKELENKIINANIININEIKNKNRINFGATVSIKDIENKKKFTYQIVGEDEANIKKKKISINSPLARALILKSKDDLIQINMQYKILKYKIITIRYI